MTIPAEKIARADQVLPEVRAIVGEMIEVRHTIHSHPELGYEERVTGDLVAEYLTAWGYHVHRGLADTGVVGQLKFGDGCGPAIGLRADMDALPIQEATGLPYASTVPNTMHACGHDGHTATLLTAARVLAEQAKAGGAGLNGTLNLIFQPAEEGLAGGERMVQEGLFDLFPCDAIFAFHNMPGFPAGHFGFLPGPFMASSDSARITVHGHGGHGSAPHLAIDPVVGAAHIITALQTIVSRNVDPRQFGVVTVGTIHGGMASNVIPQSVEMELNIRAYLPEIRAMLQERITAIAKSQAESLGLRAEVDYKHVYPPLINEAGSTEYARALAEEWLGADAVIPDLQPLTGSEDFAFMLQKRPGSYFIVGNGTGKHHSTGGCMVHNPGYDFNDGILPIVASYWVTLTRKFLAAAPEK